MKRKKKIIAILSNRRGVYMVTPHRKLMRKHRGRITAGFFQSESIQMTKSFKNSVDKAISATKQNGNPVARYDISTKRAYLEYPDGHRQYVG